MRYHLALASVFAAALGCSLPCSNNLPPAERLMHPGPGVGGPGPGVQLMGHAPLPFPGQVSQVAFIGPEGMFVQWDAFQAGMFDSQPLVAPGRYNFAQGAIYRLKVTNLPGRPGIELYPTLEVGPASPRTTAYLAHNAIPVQFTEEDLDQVLTGNFVTKVIYLPDPEFQELAVAGVETLVSTRLDPGVDPIVEADRRGAILAIIRVGNKDLEVPGAEMIGGGMGGPGMQVAYCSDCGPGGAAGAYVAGMNTPQYGMPMSGTPIGLAGPPHVPMGIPAGLQKHTIRNHTHVHIPQPTEQVKVHVKQTPGMSYPKPANHAYIHEHARTFPWIFGEPFWAKHQRIVSDRDVDCPPGH